MCFGKFSKNSTFGERFQDAGRQSGKKRSLQTSSSSPHEHVTSLMAHVSLNHSGVLKPSVLWALFSLVYDLAHYSAFMGRPNNWRNDFPTEKFM